MSDAIAALNTTLSYVVSTGPVVKSEVINVVSINAPDGEMGKAETGHLKSTIKTKRPTLLDPGTVSLTIQWIPKDTVHQAVRALYYAKEQKTWEITYSDGSEDEFEGFITKFTPSAGGNEENLTAEVVIQVNSVVRFTPGA